MPIKQYNSTSQQWEDYNEELVNESVGRCYIRGKYRVAWRGLHAHNGVRFTRWTSTNSLPSTAGNYVLMNDVTLSNTWTPPTGTTNLCLNGYQIKKTSGYIIQVSNASTILNIYDCAPFGRTRTHTVTDYYTGSGTVNITNGLIGGSNNNAIYISNGTVNMYGGTIAGNSALGVNMNGANGIFRMYGGEVAYNRSAVAGGGIRVSPGKFYMYGGKVHHNYTTGGGGIHTSGNSIVMMYDSEISNNKATSTGEDSGGAGINIGTGFTGSFLVKNCTIKDNISSGYGAGLRISSGTNVTVEDSVFKGNTANANGGGLLALYVDRSTAQRPDAVIKNVIIEENSANNGAGICIKDCTVELQNEIDISNNVSSSNGAGIYILNTSTTKISGKITVKDNIGGSADNNVYLNGSNKLTVVDELTDSEIGVKMQTAGIFTSDYSTYNEESPDTFFSSDNSSYEVTLDNGEAKLVSI